MKPLNHDFDLDQESRAIVAFLEVKWAPIARLPDLVDAIRTAALHAARGWIDRYDVGTLAHALESKRKEVLAAIKAPSDSEYYDAYLHFLGSVQSLDNTLYQVGLNLDGAWDYGRKVKRLAWHLTETFSGLTEMQPLGYMEAAGADVHDLCEAYKPSVDRDLFQGSKVEGVLSGTFPMRVALPYVKADAGQGLEPWVTLIGAIYAHFLGLQQYRNMWDLTTALTKAMPYDVPAVQFSLPKTSDNPFVRVLLTWSGTPPSEDAYRGALRYRASMSMPAAQSAAHLQAEPALMRAHAEDLRRRHEAITGRTKEQDQLIDQLMAELEKEMLST